MVKDIGQSYADNRQIKLKLCIMHVGKMILKVVEEFEISPTALAKKVGMSRSNLNNVFKRPAVDSSVLFRLSRGLDYDLFALLSIELKKEGNIVNEPIAAYGKPKIAKEKRKVMIEVELSEQEYQEIIKRGLK